MGFTKEFREFVTRGNVVDLAIGIIIGGAFGKIVSSLVNDVLMPPLGRLIGNVNFTDLYFSLDGGTYASLAAAREAGAPALAYGNFIQSVVDFLIVAFALFLLIKGMNRIRRKQEATPVAPAEPPKPSAEESLLTEIRDLMKEKSKSKD